MTKQIQLKDWTPGEKTIVNYANRDIIVGSDHFTIKKESYCRRLPEYVNFLNYFIEVYDPGEEYLAILITLKDKIEAGRFNDINLFTKALRSTMFTPTMIMKINDLHNDNYDPAYEPVTDGHLSHNDIMLASTVIKLIMPIVFHYINNNEDMHVSNRTLIYNIYKSVFPVFNQLRQVDNALFRVAGDMTLDDFIKNTSMWQSRKTGPLEFFVNLYKSTLVAETLVKCSYTQNSVSLIHVVITKQLQYFILEPLPKEDK